MTPTTTRLASLSPEKLGRLLERASERRAGAVPQVLRRNRSQTTYPLSFAQERLWFLDQLSPGSPVYNIARAVRMKGPLRLEVLKASLHAVIARHEALRTTFVLIDREPRQSIAQASVWLPQIDLTGLSPGRHEAEAERVAMEEAARPFDLAHGPLLRCTAILLGPNDHLVLFTMHHIISDGWSMQILIKEVSIAYSALGSGKAPGFPELPIQYPDLALWQREMLQGDVLEKHIDYWRNQLGSRDWTCGLPLDRPRSSGQVHQGASETIVLQPEIREQVRKLSQRMGATVFMTLAAAFQALLCRYTGESQIVIGTPIANRNRLETEGVIGFFTNILALKADFSGNPTVTDMLAQVKKTALEAYAHQDFPFEKLVEHLHPQRDTNRTPIVNVLFSVETLSPESMGLAGLELSSVRYHTGVAKCDWNVSVREDGRQLIVSCNYRKSLFDGGTIQSMLQHFAALLGKFVSATETRLSDLPLMSAAEHQALLAASRPVVANAAQPYCVHERFEQQAECRPDAIAVVFESEQLTYGELNRRANRLAHYLGSLGIGPEDRVGLCLDRSPDAVVSLFGILKSGAAYIGMDPALPEERLHYMLRESGARVVVRNRRPAMEDAVRTVALDEDWPEIARRPAENPEHLATPQNLAYVIFTSGSTGGPKAVAGEHRQFTAYLDAILPRLEVSSPASFALLQSMSVDAPTTFVYGALATGGVLHMIPASKISDGAALLDAFRSTPVDYLKIAPSHLKALLSDAADPDLLPRHLLMVGGESSSWDLVDLVRELAPWCRYLNHYGPTETTCGVITYLARPELRKPHVHDLPLGDPIATAQAYIVDADLQLVPVGVYGELLIGGGGVSRGYLNNPALTAERFVPDPFPSAPGSRLYRTGDFARRLPDGSIEFAGRRDDQVKIRGFRVELGEIEAALGDDPAIQRAAVVCQKHEGVNRLVAFFVPAGLPHDANACANACKGRLRKRLPEHMVPSSFVAMPSLPQTPQGKVDRTALRNLPVRQTSAEPGAQSLTAVQEMVAGIWCEVLSLPHPGLADSFFDVGGHSLSATRMLSRVRALFEIDLPLRAIFEAPTLGGFAEKVEEAMRSGRSQALQAIPRALRTGRLPLSFAQQRMWFLEQLKPGSHAYNIPSAVRLKGPLHLDALRLTLTEITRRHEILRTRYLSCDGEPYQVIDPPEAFRVPLVDLESLAPADREQQLHDLAQDDARRPFDLAREAPIRASVVRLNPEEHAVLLALHHIASDGWSRDILLHEIQHYYSGFLSGEPVQLPEPAVQYADFAVWQRHCVESGGQDRSDYWKKQIATPLTRLRLPRRSRAPSRTDPAGAKHSFVLPPDLAQELRRLGQREGSTLFMTLLAGFQALLHRSTEQTDIVIGTPIAGRERLELEGVLGCFANTLVLRAGVTGELTFRELLGRSRRVSLDAYMHQEMPFDKLVEIAAPERDTHRHPLFQVLFSLRRAASRPFDLGTVEIAALDNTVVNVKFDLALYMTEDRNDITGGFVYDSGLFDASLIARMAQRFQALLESVVLSPMIRLKEIPMMHEPENETGQRSRERHAVQHARLLTAARRAVTVVR